MVITMDTTIVMIITIATDGEVEVAVMTVIMTVIMMIQVITVTLEVVVMIAVHQMMMYQ